SSSSSEMQWLEERAELSSRWIWLQLRLSELDGRIEQLLELHKNIRSTKGSVVLAPSQPLTDRQIQQTLMREMAGLSCTASDADGEPCSPTRLLYNIERQSAQLNQIVNSLMPPLSFSPLSKQPSKERRTLARISDLNHMLHVKDFNRNQDSPYLVSSPTVALVILLVCALNLNAAPGQDFSLWCHCPLALLRAITFRRSWPEKNGFRDL
ncbi:hypothetical protein XENORESO_000650, partial [Xenotaenia resolanae]